ncbi:MAG TPA: energy transducer TonB [Thermoanaerobaculia bacterium]|nr:energy transducer TonB [Thermoanaerobaculia bacterium]
MFETTTIESRRRPVSALLVKTFPFSAGLHAVVISAFMAVGVWSVSFPHNTPRQPVSFTTLTEVPLPPAPPPPRASAAPHSTTPVQVITPQEVFAPTVIPDTIPVMAAEAPGVALGVEGGVEGGAVGGVVAGGKAGGEIGGQVGGVAGSVAIRKPGDPIFIARDGILPMAALSQTYPDYPESARLRGMEDELVVRYFIDRKGRVRQVDILQHAEKPMFDDAAVQAIRHWRFRPMIAESVAVEVVHELTVRFRLVVTR